MRASLLIETPGGGSLRFEDLHSTIYNWDAFSTIFSSAFWRNRG